MRCLLLLLLPLLSAQELVRTRYIPALAYGRNVWSVVRLTNSTSQPRSVRLAVYREDGTGSNSSIDFGEPLR